MAGTYDAQTYNDDLLLGELDRTAARKAFPVCNYLLDYEELRSVFRQFDDPANAAKRRSRWAGIAAVILAVLALFGASAAPLYDNSPAPWPTVIAAVSAVLGISSAAIGLGGVILGRSKKEWLYRRLVTERLRQFHFQAFVCRVAAIVESLKGPDERGRFLEDRHRWLSAFRFRFDAKLAAEFSGILQSEEFSDVWLHPPPVKVDPAVLAGLPEEFFAAYAQLRIRHQLDFAAFKLELQTGLPLRFGLRTQQAICSYGSLIATLALIGAELLVALQLIGGFHVVEQREAHVFAVWSAIVGLGFRTLQEGLQPKRELERYRRYQVAIEDILARFESTETAAHKLDVMVDMERLSFQEMCDFLRSNYEAGFVM